MDVEAEAQAEAEAGAEAACCSPSSGTSAAHGKVVSDCCSCVDRPASPAWSGVVAASVAVVGPAVVIALSAAGVGVPAAAVVASLGVLEGMDRGEGEGPEVICCCCDWAKDKTYGEGGHSNDASRRSLRASGSDVIAESREAEEDAMGGGDMAPLTVDSVLETRRSSSAVAGTSNAETGVLDKEGDRLAAVSEGAEGGTGTVGEDNVEFSSLVMAKLAVVEEEEGEEESPASPSTCSSGFKEGLGSVETDAAPSDMALQ